MPIWDYVLAYLLVFKQTPEVGGIEIYFSITINIYFCSFQIKRPSAHAKPLPVILQKSLFRVTLSIQARGSLSRGYYLH